MQEVKKVLEGAITELNGGGCEYADGSCKACAAVALIGVGQVRLEV